MVRMGRAFAACLLTLPVFMLLAFGPDVADQAPSEMTDSPVSFSEQVWPILESSCLECHGANLRMAGYSMLNREDMVSGGESGPAIVPGDSENSRLIHMIEGKVPGLQMPIGEEPLSEEQIAILRDWIDQGAVWDRQDDADEEGASIAPRMPEPPEVEGFDNPIDRLLNGYLAEHGVEWREPVDDRLYIRRVTLDITGLLPTAEAVEAFINDDSADKRTQLVRRLLSDDEAYAQHWLSFWSDHLRNAYRGTGFIDGGREQITQWLYQSLYENKPYNQFVAELINPSDASRGFLKGIIWRGVVNASQTPEMQAAQNISQVFMGTNLKCASCHDSFINEWKLKDAYGLAAVFAEEPLEIVRCDAPTGEFAEVYFLYPELGSIDGSASIEERRRQLAEIITSDENGRLTRTLVNRIWARLFGRGLVEPLDDMAAGAWHRDILDWLAADLSQNGYDVKRSIEWMLTSRAYQMSAVDYDPNDKNYVFTGPLVRRMSAEQYIDALAALTGYELLVPDHFFSRDGRGQGGHAPEDAHEKVKYSSGWIKSGTHPIDTPVGQVERIHLVSADSHEGRVPVQVEWIDPRLVGPAGELPLTEGMLRKAVSSDANAPAWIAATPDGGVQAIRIHSRSSLSFAAPAGYDRFQATVRVVEWPQTDGNMPFQVKVYVMADAPPLRAAWVYPDPLQKSMGRPNREQVVTSRDSLATTLQALELSNGETLDTILRHGARQWGELDADDSELVEAIFARAFGRSPNNDERQLSRDLIADARQEGLQDLLWIVAMHPEFQLIY